MIRHLVIATTVSIVLSVNAFSRENSITRPAPLPADTSKHAPDSAKTWINRSNAFAQMLIDLDFKYYPELGSQQGVTLYDTQVSVPTLANSVEERRNDETLLQKLEAALQIEKNPRVAQDLRVLIDYLKLRFRRKDYESTNSVVIYNPADFIFSGLSMFLDDQASADRRSAAVVRLRKYAGLEKGYRPLTEIYKERIKAQMSKKMVTYPAREKMEFDLTNSAGIVAGLPELYHKYNITGWEAAYAKLKEQVDAYDKWLRENVLVKARTDVKLPAEEYAINLAEFGVDIPPSELSKMASTAFTDLQEQMKPIAAQIAKERNFSSSDYRDVIRELKKQQFDGGEIISLYQQNLKAVEDIVRTQRLITLPERPAIIRLSSTAEAAQNSAPHMVPPPFLNNTGERGVFVLPLSLPPAADGTQGAKYDDFSFAAASWTIIAHEVRPGHELQFDKMVEDGCSKARALYSFNATNTEGWALYSEYIIRPYMPLEGQLISLNFRLQRAARAFLDPGLQAGLFTQQQALDILMKDVVLSRGYAQQEVNRYTVEFPGQADSYFYGFSQMLSLRKDTEKTLGDKFNAQRFHDFVLAQGGLPNALIREAVMNEFVPAEKAK